MTEQEVWVRAYCAALGIPQTWPNGGCHGVADRAVAEWRKRYGTEPASLKVGDRVRHVRSGDSGRVTAVSEDGCLDVCFDGDDGVFCHAADDLVLDPAPQQEQP